MKFQPLTDKLINHIKDAKDIKKSLEILNGTWRPFFEERNNKETELLKRIKNLRKNISFTLNNNGLYIDALLIDNLFDETLLNYNINTSPSTSDTRLKRIDKIIEELLNICRRIETKKENTNIEIITIDDIDNFKLVLTNVDNSSIDSKYFNSVFLEDDVKNTFLEVLDEPYKEFDSGAETRDLITNNLKINGKRYQTAIMLKGRSVKGPLILSECGKNGNQLLKLAKNNSAQVFIIQHVNKIDPDVIETLINNIYAHTTFDKIYICPINGQDTTRILKGAGKNLEELSNKIYRK